VCVQSTSLIKKKKQFDWCWWLTGTLCTDWSTSQILIVTTLCLKTESALSIDIYGWEGSGTGCTVRRIIRTIFQHRTGIHTIKSENEEKQRKYGMTRNKTISKIEYDKRWNFEIRQSSLILVSAPIWWWSRVLSFEENSKSFH
jgi:hypothetical protein